MTVIDADGHVEESKAMFSLLEKEFYDRRPLALGFDQDTIYGPNNAVWFFSNRIDPIGMWFGSLCKLKANPYPCHDCSRRW